MHKEPMATQTASSGSDHNQESESMMMTIPNLADVESTYRFFTNANLVLLIVAGIIALAIGVFSVLSNKAGAAIIRAKDNQLTLDLKEKDRQIAEANSGAAEANQEAARANESAGKANERAQKLEGDNLQLRTELEAATAESRAKQAELATEQTKLAAEQRKTAEAQREAAVAQLTLKKHLEEVAERQKPRHLSLDEERRLVAALSVSPVKGLVDIVCVLGDGEGFAIAVQLDGILKAADWPTTGVNQAA